MTMPKNKTMSATARRKIAAAQRARWANVKSAQKKSASGTQGKRRYGKPEFREPTDHRCEITGVKFRADLLNH